jgi:Flp pilus assembly pilin Flp
MAGVFAAFKAMLREDQGAAMVEYALLLALIALVAFTSIKDLGRSLDRAFDAARDAVRGF